MINITKNEIQALLNDHHTSETKSSKKMSAPKKDSKTSSKFLLALENFVAKLNQSSPEVNQLNPTQLFELVSLLLPHEIKTHSPSKKQNKTEMIARKIENMFNMARMNCFRYCSAARQLNEKVFNFICNVDNPETLPKTIEETREWLAKNNLTLASEVTISKHSHSLFQQAKMKSAAKKLGQHVIYGQLKEAEVMIMANPNLLTIPITVTDYSYRRCHGSALQLALGSEDVRYHDDEIAMVEMIIPHLLNLKNGEFIMAQQISEQFPAGWEKAHQARIARDQEALNTFMKAIVGTNNNMAWEAAAQAYRDHIDHENLGRGVIKTGLYCNAQLVAAWFGAISDHFTSTGSNLDDWDSPKNSFLRHKASYADRYLTITYAMALEQNIQEISNGERLIVRDLEPIYRLSIFPLDPEGFDRVGYERNGPTSPGEGIAFTTMRDSEFFKLCEKKYQRIESFIEMATQTLINKVKP